MEKVTLGGTGLEISRLGFGTGTAHPRGLSAQSMMTERELSDLVLRAYDRGVNFWDTALAYGTHPHLRRALKCLPREAVVVATKLATSGKDETRRALEESLRQLGCDYVDLCLVHGVRSAREFERRRGAIEAILEGKARGEVRAAGLSSHGLGALTAAAGAEEIEVVWGRVNFRGLCMDSCRPGLYDRMASVPWLKRAVTAAVPKRLRSAVKPGPRVGRVDAAGRGTVEELLRRIHRQGKGVVGMKVLAEGALGGEAERAIRYVRDLGFVDSLVIGMMNQEEVDVNIHLLA